MNEQLEKILAAIKTQQAGGQVDEEAMDEVVREYALSILEKSEPVMAISGDTINDTAKYIFSMGETLGLSAAGSQFQMTVTLLGLHEQLSNFAALVTAMMVGYLIDEGYLVIDHLPALDTIIPVHTGEEPDASLLSAFMQTESFQDDGWEIDPDGTPTLTINGDDDDEPVM